MRANIASPSLLQQYRHRNILRQNVALYQRACRAISSVQAATSGCSVYHSTPASCSRSPSYYTPIHRAQQILGEYSYSFFDESQYSTPQLPANRRPSPTSQLYLWRQNKLKQAVLSGGLHASFLPELSATFRYPQIPPELAIYRGRRNSEATGLLPLNLCDSLERLFRTHNDSSLAEISSPKGFAKDVTDQSCTDGVSTVIE